MSRLIHYQRALFFVSGGVLLGIVLLNYEVPQLAQITLLAILVGLVGLPHGALDPLVAREAGLWTDGPSLSRFLLAYVALGGAALLVWLVTPFVSLLIFLLYSAFHFSGDWRDDLPLPFRLAVGLYIVSASALFFPDLTAHAFGLLTDEPSGAMAVKVMRTLALPALLLIAVALLSPKAPLITKVEILALLVAGYLMQPLLFFLLYFCAQHSPRHLIHAAYGLPAKAVIGTAALFTLLTVLLALSAFPMLQTLPRMDAIIQIVFVGLAILTVPHMLLVEYAARGGSGAPAFH
jgi:Brp/Blh family beta-carotene 15,15'-monooxygenase